MIRWEKGTVKQEYGYDGLNHRVWKKTYQSGSLTDFTRYLYDGGRMIAETDPSGVVKKRYTRGLDLSGTLEGAGGIGGLLAFNDGFNKAYYLADGNGNIVKMFDHFNQVVAQYQYSAFGQKLTQSGALADLNPMQWSSKEFDVETSYSYYLFRFYNPELGRWINRDPIQEIGGMNLYSFTQNSATNKYDVWGLLGLDIVSKSYINGVGALGSLDPDLPYLELEELIKLAPADPFVKYLVYLGLKEIFSDSNNRLAVFGTFVGIMPAFNQFPGSDAKDGQYRLYTRLSMDATCVCQKGKIYKAQFSGLTTDMEGGSELPWINGTINLNQSVTSESNNVSVSWTGWGRPNMIVEPGMQWVALRQERNIWHEGAITISCDKETPIFNLNSFRGSKFPSHRYWINGVAGDEISQQEFSNLWSL